MKLNFATTSILVLFLFFEISCSSDSSENETVPETFENEFALSIDLDRTVFGVDERILINASSPETLTRGCIITENGFDIDKCLAGALDRQFYVNLSFQDTGSKTITIEAQTPDLRVARIERQIEIDSFTNSVRISKITVNKYPNMGLTNDPEFSDSDPERLADLVFRINKRHVIIDVTDEPTPRYNFVDLPDTSVIENESSFEWNFEGNEMRFNRDNALFFELFDFDGGQNLDQVLGNVVVLFWNYADEKPSQINVDNFGGSIDVTFDLEWN